MAVDYSVSAVSIFTGGVLEQNAPEDRREHLYTIHLLSIINHQRHWHHINKAYTL